MGIIEYNYEWTRAFHTLFSQIVIELGDVCYPKSSLRMTSGKVWEYKCMNHGNIKNNFTCCAIYYCIHPLDTTMHLLTNSAYFSDRENTRDRSTQKFPPMVRYLYRMVAHIYYHDRKLFDSLEYRYRIVERLTLYCKNSNIIEEPKEYCIKI
jgi:hypothetical protein